MDIDLVRLSKNPSHVKLGCVSLRTILNISAFRWREQPADMRDVYNRIFDASGSRRIFNSPTTTSLVPHEDGWDEIGKHAYAHCEEIERDVHSLPCLDDCFCTISVYRIGLYPAGTRVSDTIVILHGGSVPYILREMPLAGGFDFEGECHVHGAINGSAFDLGLNTEPIVEKFILV